tara:strand:- start:257 stop:616 length:360 start_codon:yes stop_codon:yes gene_type:complete
MVSKQTNRNGCRGEYLMIVSFNLFNGGNWKLDDEKRETYLRLLSVGEENPNEICAKTRALLGFCYYREKFVPDDEPELWWNDYWILFEFLWFKKKIEICGKTLREAIYNYVTWKKEENI